MPRLSIVIPSLGSVEQLEATLVSVLEHRPQACEIIVAMNHAYADPYHLAGEVKFIAAVKGSGLVACAKLGFAASQSPLLHLLAAGVIVTEGWTDAALAHFATGRVAAVAPASMTGSRVAPLAVRYLAGGQRALESPHQPLSEASAVLGPTSLAAFYRKTALDFVGGLTEAVGDELADVELAVSLRSAGFVAVYEPASRVCLNGTAGQTRSGFRRGMLAEQLFWRNIPAHGWGPSLLKHPFTVLSESMASLPRAAALTQLLGRVAGFCRMGEHFRRQRRLRHLQKHAAAVSAVAQTSRLRVDAAHPGPGAARGDQQASATASTNSVFSG